MMIFSLVAMTGLEKCCITSAYLQWLCHSGELADILAWPLECGHLYLTLTYIPQSTDFVMFLHLGQFLSNYWSYSR